MGKTADKVFEVLNQAILTLTRRVSKLESTGGGGGGGSSITSLTGDVTATGPGAAAATIAGNAVTFAKMQDISAASRLLGRGSAAGAGDPEEISLGTGLSMTGTTLSATGTGGTVTTTGSPASGNLTKFSGASSITNGDLSGDVTTSGTLTTTIANDAVSNAKLANMAQSTIKGRAAAAGTGDPTDLTANETSTILDGATDPFVRTSAAGVTVSVFKHVVDGRLTLESGVPVSASDQSAKTTIYFTPYNGNQIAIYNGSVWKSYTFSEISVALGTLTSGALYDVFAYDSGGNVTLKIGPAWSSITARGTGAGTTELDLQDGVYVNKVSITSGPGAKAGRYLGTFGTSSTTTTEDTQGGTTSQVGAKRFLWNAYNQVLRPMKVIDTTDSWSYTTDVWRLADGGAISAPSNCVEVVLGLPTPYIQVNVNASVGLQANSTNAAKAGIGLDTTGTVIGTRTAGFNAVNSFIAMTLTAHANGPLGIGYHYFSWMERGANGTTSLFYGDNANDGIQSGMHGVLLN